ELRAAATRLDRDGGAPFFAFESHFGDVLAWGGFDLVAGNPPWVRGERVPMRVREALATRYATWRPARGRGFAHLPDLAVAFVERALELAAPGGTAALLVPAKLASSGYAEPLRRRLAEGARVERVAPMPAGSAFAAAVYPMVLVTTRAGAAIWGRGAPRPASTCCGPTRPTAGRSPACRPSSPRRSHRTWIGWAAAATTARGRPGSCFAQPSPTRPAAWSGPISRAGSRPWCPPRSSCR